MFISRNCFTAYIARELTTFAAFDFVALIDARSVRDAAFLSRLTPSVLTKAAENAVNMRVRKQHDWTNLLGTWDIYASMHWLERQT
jgi:hypothetical protein